MLDDVADGVTFLYKEARYCRKGSGIAGLYVVRDDGAEDSTQMTLCCAVRCT